MQRKIIFGGCVSLTPAITSSSCISKSQGGVPVMLQKHESVVCISKGNRVEAGTVVLQGRSVMYTTEHSLA